MDHKNKLRYIDEINVELRTKIRKQRLSFIQFYNDERLKLQQLFDR